MFSLLFLVASQGLFAANSATAGHVDDDAGVRPFKWLSGNFYFGVSAAESIRRGRGI